MPNGQIFAKIGPVRVFFLLQGVNQFLI